MRRRTSDKLTRSEQEKFRHNSDIGLRLLEGFRNKYDGQCIVACNGRSLLDIPLEWFDQRIVFGVNYCHLYPGDFRPTFHVTGDYAVAVEPGQWDALLAKLPDTTKFVPHPGMMMWDDPGLVRYWRRASKVESFGPNIDPTKPGVAFTTVAQLVAVLANFMGFTKIVYVGLDGGDALEHFYDRRIADKRVSGSPKALKTMRNWDGGFAKLQALLPKRTQLINASEKSTYVSLPRANWRDL